MSNFEDIERLWGGQQDRHTKPTAFSLLAKAKTETARLRNQFLATILILGLTVIGLLTYMYAYQTYRILPFFVCHSLMIVVLVLRITLECCSFVSLKKRPITGGVLEDLTHMARFYKGRRNVNFFFTPLIFMAYWGAFYGLLPYFKESLSGSLYTYIQCSGVVIFVALLLIIVNSIRKEMKTLNQIKAYLMAYKNL